jgi:hypothetical protein
MASTLTSVTATVTTTVSYTLGNSVFTRSFVETVAANKDPIAQVIPVTTTTINILEIDSSLDAGNLLSLKKAIFFNHDDTNVVTLGFVTTGGDTFYVVLPAGKLFTIEDVRSDVNTTGAAAAALAAFTSWDVVTARADSATVDLEMIAWA